MVSQRLCPNFYKFCPYITGFEKSIGSARGSDSIFINDGLYLLNFEKLSGQAEAQLKFSYIVAKST